MTWFFIALLGPFLYALTNHIDKILLERYFKEGGVGTLILFSALLSLMAVPFIYLIDPDVLSVGLRNILILGLVSFMNVGVLWCYLLALKDEEASVAVVFYQLVPVFGFVLGFILLGEVLTTMQLAAMGIIILGTSVVSFEIDSENKFKLRGKTVGLMLGAAFLWALESVTFKLVALEENVWRSLFWEHLMLALVGVIIFLFVQSYRKHFISAIRSNSGTILSLNVLNESLYMLGNISFSFAYLLAPVALVLLTESYQPLFVLIIGVILTIFFPRIAVEKIQAKHLWQKVFAVCITGLGTYLLLST